MSALHAVANVIATPVPVPSPQVIREVVTNTVPQQVPAAVLQLAQTLGLAAAVAVVSLVHQLTIKNRLAGNVQRLIVVVYSAIAAFTTAALSGHVGVSANDINVEVTSLLVALGASLGRYEYLYKAIVSALATPAPDAPALATEEVPQAG